MVLQKAQISRFVLQMAWFSADVKDARVGRVPTIEHLLPRQACSCLYLGLETELKPQPAEELLLLAAPLAPLATGSR